MKGLLVSLLTFAIYAVFTVVVSHGLHIQRHGRLFFRSVALCSPFYFLVYFLTPPDLWFLPANWIGRPIWMEVVYGYAVFLLNCHSYIDFFFGFTGGFSMSLMREILLAGDNGCSTDEMVAGFLTANGDDKIYRRRIPHLAEAGMITVEGPGERCVATRKGRRWAMTLASAKRLLGLSKGG